MVSNYTYRAGANAKTRGHASHPGLAFNYRKCKMTKRDITAVPQDTRVSYTYKDNSDKVQLSKGFTPKGKDQAKNHGILVTHIGPDPHTVDQLVAKLKQAGVDNPRRVFRRASRAGMFNGVAKQTRLDAYKANVAKAQTA